MGMAFMYFIFTILVVLIEIVACIEYKQLGIGIEFCDIVSKKGLIITSVSLIIINVMFITYIITCITSTINYEGQRENINTETIKLECVNNEYIIAETEETDYYRCYCKDNDNAITLENIPISKSKIYKNKGETAKIEVYNKCLKEEVKNDWFFKLTYILDYGEKDTTYKICLPV